MLTVACVTTQIVAGRDLSGIHTERQPYVRQACTQHIKHAYGASEHASHQLSADAVMQQGGPVPSALDVEHDEFV